MIFGKTRFPIGFIRVKQKINTGNGTALFSFGSGTCSWSLNTTGFLVNLEVANKNDP